MHYISGYVLAILELWLYEVINSVGVMIMKYSTGLVGFDLIVNITHQ